MQGHPSTYTLEESSYTMFSSTSASRSLNKHNLEEYSPHTCHNGEQQILVAYISYTSAYMLTRRRHHKDDAACLSISEYSEYSSRLCLFRLHDVNADALLNMVYPLASNVEVLGCLCMCYTYHMHNALSFCIMPYHFVYTNTYICLLLCASFMCTVLLFTVNTVVYLDHDFTMIPSYDRTIDANSIISYRSEAMDPLWVSHPMA